MPYAFVNEAGQITTVFRKPNPFMQLAAGERMVAYDPPSHDAELEDVEPITPIDEFDLSVKFRVNPKSAEHVRSVITKRKSVVIQSALDAKAVQMGYDSALAAVSYASSGHPIYGPEGQQFSAWRDACWSYLFAVLDQQTAVPSDEELLAGLPLYGAGA